MSRAIVIPTYNEAGNIGPLVEGIRTACGDVAIIVVDDGSPDGTGALAEAMDSVEVIQRGSKQGLGTAYIEGFTRALAQGFSEIAGMDADFSHEPAVLPALFNLLETYDVAIGARYVPGGAVREWGVHRRMLSRTANFVARRWLGMPVHDLTSGFRAYRREALERIGLDGIRACGYAFLVEVLYRCHRRGCTMAETPIVFHDRRQGASKLDRKEIAAGVVNLFRLRFGGP